MPACRYGLISSGCWAQVRAQPLHPEGLGAGQPEAGQPEAGDRRAPCLRGELPVSRELGQSLPVTAVSELVAWRPHTAKGPEAGPAPEVSLRPCGQPPKTRAPSWLPVTSFTVPVHFPKTVSRKCVF